MLGRDALQVSRPAGAVCGSLVRYPFRVDWTPQAIQQSRTQKGWTQRQLADAMTDAMATADGTYRTTARSITDWERGKAVPSGRNIAALNKVFQPAPATDMTLSEASFYDLIARIVTLYNEAVARAQPVVEYQPGSPDGDQLIAGPSTRTDQTVTQKPDNTDVKRETGHRR